MHTKVILITAYLSLFAAACTPLAQSSGSAASTSTASKTLVLADFAYEPNIKTILLYPGSQTNPMTPAVSPLGQWDLLLEFDDLNGAQESYNMRIIHCNHDWTRSDLLDLDFMTTYNEFPINQYEYSTDTHIPYIHYQAQLPPVKIPGNYVVAVYRGSDKNDVILTRRFMIYAPQVTFERTGNLIGPGQMAGRNQQLNFVVNYKDVTILNPLQDVYVTIRQNQRWDNLAGEVKPSFVRENSSELEYRFFDPDKMFRGGNEFRFFDFRSLNSPGQNIASVDKNNKPYNVSVMKDKSRSSEAYSQYNDLNGNFYIRTLDYQDQSTTNYAYVDFTLASPSPVKGEVYVMGAFNYWNKDDINRMTYVPDAGEYKASVLLKQGWYDYQYLVRSDSVPADYFEGSHFETENMYEIFFYYRPYKPRADLLIGYMRINENSR